MPLELNKIERFKYNSYLMILITGKAKMNYKKRKRFPKKEVRYETLKLLKKEPMSLRRIMRNLKYTEHTIRKILFELIGEGFVKRSKHEGIYVYHLPDHDPTDAIIISQCSKRGRRNPIGKGTKKRTKKSETDEGKIFKLLKEAAKGGKTQD
jgi:predicted transcriptional regulator